MAGTDRTPHIVIVGGGVAGLEALMALRDLAGDRVELTLVAPDPDFKYKPLAVEEPFSISLRSSVRSSRSHASSEPLRQAAVERVAPADHWWSSPPGERLHYAKLLVCVGGRPKPPSATARRSWLQANPPDRRAAGERSRHAVEEDCLRGPAGVTWPLPSTSWRSWPGAAPRAWASRPRARGDHPGIGPLIMFGRARAVR